MSFPSPVPRQAPPPGADSPVGTDAQRGNVDPLLLRIEEFREKSKQIPPGAWTRIGKEWDAAMGNPDLPYGWELGAKNVTELMERYHQLTKDER